MPSTYGVKKSCCFCCKKTSKVSQTLLGNDGTYVNENDPIIINKLSKKFGAVTAVDELSLSIREGEVFTFLGHNGAGKTTVIQMLTGVIQPTSGDAIMYRSSILDNIDKVQKNLGVCQ
tara:strand:- start:520 stop:873 length:354 start_codon:yes stop_codon:yes gene_type:complete